MTTRHFWNWYHQKTDLTVQKAKRRKHVMTEDVVLWVEIKTAWLLVSKTIFRGERSEIDQTKETLQVKIMTYCSYGRCNHTFFICFFFGNFSSTVCNMLNKTAKNHLPNAFFLFCSIAQQNFNHFLKWQFSRAHLCTLVVPQVPSLWCSRISAPRFSSLLHYRSLQRFGEICCRRTLIEFNFDY